MLLPIRPRPIIPSCIPITPCLSAQRLLDGRAQRRESALDVREVNAQRTPTPFVQNLEISPRLRCLDGAECVLASGYLQIDVVVARDLEEYPGVRTPFVRLTRGMQKAGTEAHTGGNPPAVTHGTADGRQRLRVDAVHLDVRQQRKIVPGSQLI